MHDLNSIINDLQITSDVISEFAADNVKYLELRTTPRSEKSTGMTKKSYIETVLKAIEVLVLQIKALLACSVHH